MSAFASSIRIGIYGSDGAQTAPGRGWGLWPTGYPAALTAAGADPVTLDPPGPGDCWDDVLHGLSAVVLAGHDRPGAASPADQEGLCRWCRDQNLPLLAIDHGLHTLN